MIIDFHTHVFPEKIARGTIAALEMQADVKAFCDGTADGLKQSMKKAGIDYSVVMPVVTRPSQFESLNRYAAEINNKDGLISFGGIHPNTLHYRSELEQIKELGLKGIKLHPDYQGCYIDNELNVRIIDYALTLGLLVAVHAGIDIGLPEPFHCTPPRIVSLLKMLGKKQEGKTSGLIFAHTGGFGFWNLVEEQLVGLDIYFDISYSLGFIPDEQLVRIINNHGAERILFGTDSPWAGQQETLAYFDKLPITLENKELILHSNAEKLL